MITLKILLEVQYSLKLNWIIIPLQGIYIINSYTKMLLFYSDNICLDLLICIPVSSCIFPLPLRASSVLILFVYETCSLDFLKVKFYCW